MAVWVVRSAADLGQATVLAPERYHPGRTLTLDQSEAKVQARLADLVDMKNDVMPPHAVRTMKARYLILDTSDVAEGVVHVGKDLVTGEEVGSAKKRLRPGDVVISRLRPYLRQVGYIDNELWDPIGTKEMDVVCSTEFYVFRSRDAKPIAFLVPFLLSREVQQVLSSATEGGHHPRVPADVILSLPVPDDALAVRDVLSREIESASANLRASEGGVRRAVHRVNEVFARKREGIRQGNAEDRSS